MAVNRPRVTIVIPFYNDPYVTEAVDSALAQTYSNTEIIVVDDGSTQHADKLRQYDGRVHYLGKSNGGTASALNHGFRHASGDYIAWLSSDDRFYPEKIERQLAGMERCGAWISHTGFDQIDAGGKLTSLAVMPPSNDKWQFYRAFQNSNPVNGCTVMMSKSLYGHIGAFDESLPFTHDLDYWFRVLLAGIPFPLVAETLSAYRWHDSMGTLRSRDAVEREAKQTFAKYAKRWQIFTAKLGMAQSAVGGTS
ncbi:hypothetical protein PAECIP111893_02473 [Paenibacillus plantiphilus]|uniref:Glycosyltransferase 2-like domain-containing protein n=1 Tax=Paenibacillus plantiphilus TaxID=2905650 RepID=A0ABN8GH94_9BACL|nr:glycosyltransferase [Paenibacillus plantiphilus]CAH1206223.1 hypothetical protein PAECIP111893_02473 [Paenibacillus plantiphilus]